MHCSLGPVSSFEREDREEEGARDPLRVVDNPRPNRTVEPRRTPEEGTGTREGSPPSGNSSPLPHNGHALHPFSPFLRVPLQVPPFCLGPFGPFPPGIPHETAQRGAYDLAFGHRSAIVVLWSSIPTPSRRRFDALLGARSPSEGSE